MKLDRSSSGAAVPLSLSNGWRGIRDEQIALEVIVQALSAHETGSGETVKSDHRSLVTACEVEGVALVVKEVRKAGARRRIADVFRGAPALRAFRAGRRLLEHGIGAARPLAAVAQRVLGVPLRSRLVSLDLRDEPTAASLLAQDLAVRPQVLSALADLLIALHRCCVVHGDLRAQHVHVEAGEAEGPHLRLIDLESVHFHGRRFGKRRSRQGLSDAQRLAAIGQLLGSIPAEHATPEERRAAFDRYVDELPLAAGADQAWSEVRRMVSHW